MSRGILLSMFYLWAHLDVFGRPMQSYDMKTLITKSQIVFVGRVLSVQPSGVTTSLTYATWGGVTFGWLAADVEVLEPIKGAHRGDVVHTFMLFTDRPIMFNPPGTVEPKNGETFLLCLAPTTRTNVFAAVTAPFDDQESIFRLDRSDPRYRSYRNGAIRRRLDGEILGEPFKELYSWVWRLVNDEGGIVPRGAERMRKAFAKQIQIHRGPTVIYLQWETPTNSAGWHWNEPKTNATTLNQPAK